MADSLEEAAQADWSACACGRDEFVALVRDRGRELYREMPWRHIDDAYGVLVSEVMLQQTQVSRVLRHWPRWMQAFPTVDALAAADTAAVLDAWQGLGYNRRALALKRACEQCSAQGSALPQSYEGLVELPGIGPATAGGVMAFAYDRPSVYLETNVRSVFLHHLLPGEEGVPDKRLVPYVADACPEDDPRDWYYALLDYGSQLKAQGVNPNRRSRHYARQGAFEGSHREKRSQLLKCVLACPEGIALAEAHRQLDAYEVAAGRDGLQPREIAALADELAAEGFFRREGDLLVP